MTDIKSKYEEKDNWEAGNTFLNAIGEHKKVIVFVQKSNDMDTCASAVSLCKIIRSIWSNKWCRIAGLKIESTKLKESERWALTKEEAEKLENSEDRNILGILVDIPSESQVADSNKLKYCSELIIIDHHELDEDQWSKEVKERLVYINSQPEASSCSEIMWDLAKIWITPDKNKMKEIGEILFLGLFSDSQDFISSRTNYITFRTVSEMQQYGIDIPNAIKKERRQSFRFSQLYAELISMAVKEKNLLVMNLKAETVLRIMPELLKRDKATGKIRQKRSFLFPLNHARNTIKANTFVFIHYSLFEPQSIRRMVYIVLDKENKDLELLLEKHNFKNQRNRWFKEMSFSDICELLDGNKHIFTR